LSSLVLSIYRYIVDTDMIDVSIQSDQSMTGLFKTCPMWFMLLNLIFPTIQTNTYPWE